MIPQVLRKLKFVQKSWNSDEVEKLAINMTELIAPVPVFLFKTGYIFGRYDKVRKNYATFKWLYNHLKVV